MSKQDRQGVRTAQDLERKYNLGLLAQGGSRDNYENNSDQVSKIAQELSEYKINVSARFQNVDTSINENQQAIKNHAENNDVHITTSDKTKLNAAYEHANSSSRNPHNVTKSDVGLGNVDNTSDADKPVSNAQLSAISDAKKAGTDAQTSINSHEANKGNPHGVTKAQVGLGSVDNTSDINKPVSTAQQTAIDKTLENANAYTDEKVAGLSIEGGIGLSYKEETESITLVTGMSSEEDLNLLIKVDQELEEHKANANEVIANIVNGTTVVAKSTHAVSSDSSATSSNSGKLGGQLPSYYAKASDIPTGAMANKNSVSESDLDSALASKVNSASQERHSHSNKTVLDGITSANVSSWDSAESNAKSYTDTKVTGMATTSVVDSKVSAHNTSTTAHGDIRELITALQGLLDEHGHDISDITNLQTALNNKVSNSVEYYGDVNNLVTSGFYRVGTNANIPPDCQYGQIIVSRGSDTVTQLAFSYHNGRVFTRSCNMPNGTPAWGEWAEFYTNLNPPASGGGGGFDLSYDAGNEAINLLGGGGSSSWNLLAEKTGTTGTISLPTVFNELHILIGISNYMYTFDILADYLTSTDMTFRNGYALSTSVYGDVYVSVKKTAISAWTVRKENVIQTATVKVYYR